jgi:5-methylcytosine-specific restriction protein A
MPRSVPEWIGKTEDSKIPDRVQLRIFDREGGRCYLTGRKVSAGEYDFEHVIALALWTGEGHGNRESNIRLAYRPAHRDKTRQDVAQKAKSDRVRKKHLGISRSKHNWGSQRLGNGNQQRTASRPLTKRVGHFPEQV